uniref:Apple domain-containing protein n=1 Tax=Caenorhabditis japonica TaxID=281687 RepID=A0A8R1DJU5_CAEJA
MILYTLLYLCLVTSIYAKSVAVEDGCDQSQVSFFVTDNAQLVTDDFIVYKAISEDECLKTCSQNRDKFERPIICNSFTYDHASFSCTIQKEKSTPIGSGQVRTSLGKRYFEKICLTHNANPQCQLSQFIRVDQSVLVGYAVNMTLTDSIESCVSECIQEENCKSAMYFYEDGECITNKESALTKPSGFTKEENDKVIYFQNGCNNNNHIKTQNEDTSDAEETVEKVKPIAVTQISETTQKPTSDESAINEETTNAVAQAVQESEDEYEEEDELPESTEAPKEVVDDKSELPSASASDSEYSLPSLKSSIKKNSATHPRNFGSKTYEILKKQETVKKVKSEVIEAEEDSVEKEEAPVKVEDAFFSEWSDWTPCTKSEERQVRRRRCLNLRKCLGALMQVQNCPEIVQKPILQSHESVRSVVTADGDEYDEPITVDNISDDSVFSRPAPVINEQVWSPWQGTCQQFASSQPCNNGNMIGFESRECIAKNPTQCEGPFFRYCTLQC